MPSKNVIKQYGEGQFYHVYNRGVNKQAIFHDKKDYAVFMNLLKRYLSPEKTEDSRGNVYENYSERVELNAFCLMPNHFHMLLLLKKEADSVTGFMRKVCGSYTVYFNKRHNRVGHLFQSVFKASLVFEDKYLQHVTRYIHLNPRDYQNWDYSSYKQYTGGSLYEWMRPSSVMANQSAKDYKEFVEDYADYKNTLEDIKIQLAG